MLWIESHHGLVNMKQKSDQDVQGTGPITRSFALNQKNAATTVSIFPSTNPDQVLLTFLHGAGQFRSEVIATLVVPVASHLGLLVTIAFIHHQVGIERSTVAGAQAEGARAYRAVREPHIRKHFTEVRPRALGIVVGIAAGRRPVGREGHFSI